VLLEAVQRDRLMLHAPHQLRPDITSHVNEFPALPLLGFGAWVLDDDGESPHERPKHFTSALQADATA